MLARSVQELGLAAWFGRSLIGALGETNGAGHGDGADQRRSIGAY